MSKKTKRIGIYAGTFNPIHAGHITFALQAIKTAKLDAVYFLAERQPRGKQGVEHYGHRMAMIDRAIKPHTKFGLLDMPDVNFTMKRTIPRLKKHFRDVQLVFLFGSDVAQSISSWPYADQILSETEIIIGMREHDDAKALRSAIGHWKTHPKRLHIVDSYAPSVSSRVIREALRRREYAQGLLASVRRYSDRHWLYVSLA